MFLWDIFSKVMFLRTFSLLTTYLRTFSFGGVANGVKMPASKPTGSEFDTRYRQFFFVFTATCYSSEAGVVAPRKRIKRQKLAWGFGHCVYGLNDVLRIERHLWDHGPAGNTLEGFLFLPRCQFLLWLALEGGTKVGQREKCRQPIMIGK